jgi:periplasmic copper chaperone A
MSTNRFMRRFGQVGVVLTAAGFAVLVGGGIASAHVTANVIGEQATQGGFAKITFRVPTEDETAGTVKLAVKFPEDHPVASLSTKAVPGWTVSVTKVKLATPIKTDDAEVSEAVSTITWTANPGVRIGPGEFGEFEVSGGPFPDNTDKLIIPAVQTYDNGKVVSWIDQPAAAGAAEPEHPAPVVALSPKGSGDGDHMSPAPANTNQPVANTASTTSTSGTDDTARWLGGIGLVVGALGLGLGAGATLRARRVVATAKADDKS